MAEETMAVAGSIGGLMQQEAKLRALHEQQQSLNLERRFNELIARVLQVIHIDRDSYGPLSVTESEVSLQFKAKIQAICKEYL